MQPSRLCAGALWPSTHCASLTVACAARAGGRLAEEPWWYGIKATGGHTSRGTCSIACRVPAAVQTPARGILGRLDGDQRGRSGERSHIEHLGCCPRPEDSWLGRRHAGCHQCPCATIRSGCIPQIVFSPSQSFLANPSCQSVRQKLTPWQLVRSQMKGFCASLILPILQLTTLP